MEGLAMHDAYLLNGEDDIGASVLSRFSTSDDEEDRQLCVVVGAMAQELKDQNVSLSPVAYFGATVYALDRLSSDDKAVDSLLCFLSFVMPRISPGILQKKRQFCCSFWLGFSSVVQCEGGRNYSLLVIRDASAGWSDVSDFYGFLLGFITDSDAKARQESYQCIRDVLQSFQGSPLIAPANSLNLLCLHPTVEVSAEALVDLLGSLAGSVAMEETSADGLTCTARLLDVGMRKVHTLNRQICIDRLPSVLNALQDIFGFGFEEAKFAATEAMKNLIQSCIDEELIKQGIEQ
ncbi:hypothetical protein Cgig2_006327 [Carnegiea gigantea]|uniref:RRP12 N-terminal HEAT domain-containing protein n=1 Tax=Carnegiea gigantea TaxID=171969 RepID=A0A9Q1Q7N7_9CARY|nr:hypothetical protein Cgig2_006327 [Carnegiea gigantea]